MEIKEHMRTYDKCYKEQDDFYQKAADYAGLSDAGFWIMYRLCQDEKSCLQSELSQEWCFSKQTINSAVVKLKDCGYVMLEAISGGGNRKALTLTPEGRRFCNKKIVPVIRAEEKSFEGLTEEERETLIRLMKKQLEILYREMENIWQ